MYAFIEVVSAAASNFVAWCSVYDDVAAGHALLDGTGSRAERLLRRPARDFHVHSKELRF
jgi:hypothetical protein